MMDKIGRFTIGLLALLVSNQEETRRISRIPQKSFHHHRKFFMRPQNIPFQPDEEYSKYIRENTGWYETQLKNPRDDLIVHESVPRFWAYSLSSKRIKVSRVRHDKYNIERLYGLRDKYCARFPTIVNKENFFNLLDFFEKNQSSLEDKDKDKIKVIRKYYGGPFPDIPTVYKRIYEHMDFLNTHFLRKAKATLEL